MDDSHLMFDSSVLQNQGETYSSLTDMNNIPIFTESFERKVVYMKELNCRDEQILIRQPFMDVMRDRSEDTVIMGKLFQGQSQRFVKADPEISGTEDFGGYIFLAVCFSVFFFIMFAYCRRRKIWKMKVQN